jgi:hypothetical protein
MTMKNSKFGCMLILLAVLGVNTVAVADEAGVTTKTVWVDGKGQDSMAREASEMHDKMNASGWRFADLAIYTEDGDMKGMFVTYVRDSVAGSAN